MILEARSRLGIQRIITAGRAYILKNFDAFSKTDFFLRLDEGTLSSLVEDDRLVTASEGQVLQGVIRWTKVGEGEDGRWGEEVLRRVWYPMMARAYVRDQVLELGAEGSAVRDLGEEALAYLETQWDRRREFQARHMHPSALHRREWLVG